MVDKQKYKTVSLWHYTSIETLFKILNSKTIRFSDSKYLNDSAEVKHGTELLISYFEKVNAPEWIITHLHSSLQSVTSKTFVFSLSEQEDSLYQWIAYTPAGGCAINFQIAVEEKTSGLCKEQLSCSNNFDETGWHPNLNLYKCLYFNKEKEMEQMKPDLKKHLLLVWDRISKENMESEEEAPVLLALDSFVKRIKHHAFSPEKEWRGVLTCDYWFESPQVIYEGKKPYIEVGFNPTIIKHVRISPHGDVERNVGLVKDFDACQHNYFKNKDEFDVYDFTIDKSEIPYRG